MNDSAGKMSSILDASVYQCQLKTMCSKRKYVAIFTNLTLNVLKINNKKDFLQVLRVKKPLRYHDGTTFNLQSDTKTFFNENLCG